MKPERMDGRTVAAVATTLILWSSAFAGIRAGLAGYGPIELALLRFLTASFVLLGYAAFGRMRWPNRGDLPGVVLCGFLGITVYHVALNVGEQTVTAGAASLLIASVPVFTGLLAVSFLKERLTVYGWMGISASFLGVVLIALGESRTGFRLEPGALLILLAAIATSVHFIILKPYLRRYTALEFTTWSIWAGTAWMLWDLPALARQVTDAPLEATLAGIYLGIFPAALAYVTWSYALSRRPASTLMSYLYLNPVMAILIAWIWLGEIPTWLSWVGGGLAIGGVAIVNSLGRVHLVPSGAAEFRGTDGP